MLDPAGQDRLAQDADDARRNVRGGLRPHQVLGQQHELVAAQARDEIAVTDCAQQMLGDREQHLVAGIVAIGVVDLLEAVEIEQEDRVHLPLGRRRCRCRRQRLLELAAVGEAGERVLVGELARPSLGGDAPGHLALLLHIAARSEDQQADRQHAAEQQRLVELDELLLHRHAALRDEDVDLEGDVGEHQHHGQDQTEILDADAMLHDEVPDLGQGGPPEPRDSAHPAPVGRPTPCRTDGSGNRRMIAGSR